MIFNDHDNPHIHVYRHRTQLAIVLFDGTIREGELESDKLKLIRQWLKKRQQELLVNWERAKLSQRLERIEP